MSKYFARINLGDVFVVFCETYKKLQNLKIICAKINLVKAIRAEFSLKDDTHHLFIKVRWTQTNGPHTIAVLRS